MPYRRALWTTAASGGIVTTGLALHEAIEELRRQVLQQIRAFADADDRVEVVEDVVGPPGESVQRVHGGALFGGKQPGGEEEGRPCCALSSRQRR